MPTSVVRLVCQAMVYLNIDYIKSKGGDIIRKADPTQVGGKKIEDFFETAKSYLLNEPQKLLDELMNYDKENINPKAIANIDRELMTNPDFTYERAESSAYALKFMYAWVDAMFKFHKVFINTKPLREQLDSMKKIVAEKTEELKVKKAELTKINDKIQELEDLFESKIAEKERLTKEINNCEIKLDRAQKLTEGLSDEKVRWGVEVDSLSSKFDLLAGDSLIGAGMVSYTGIFTSEFRNELEKGWVAKLDELGIQHSPGIQMTQFLGDKVKI